MSDAITRPNPMEIAGALKSLFEEAWPSGKFLRHPQTAIKPVSYAEQLQGERGYVEGAVIEPGPDRWADKGRGWPVISTQIVTALLSYDDRRPQDDKESADYFGEMCAALRKAVEDKQNLGFTTPEGEIEPVYDVHVLAFYNPVGYLRLQGSLGEYHYAPMRVDVWATRC
jgi:hypothetical protein